MNPLLMSLWEVRIHLPELIGMIRKGRYIVVQYEGLRDVAVVRLSELRRLEELAGERISHHSC